ncbi:MAG: hypothetical protein ABJG78_16850 [Cyclobacteriaceae bacterium]
MNLIPLFFLLHVLPISEPEVKELKDLKQVEILNAIDDFKQYHTNSFKVNLFRRVSSANKESNGFRIVNYIIGIVTYSQSDSPLLFEVGNFDSPQITRSRREKETLFLSIEHGKEHQKKNITLLVTKDGVSLRD